MSESSDRPIKTFTIGFEDSEGFDERRYARLVAERFGTDHTEFVVKPQAVDVIEKLVWHYDQPFGDSSAIPMYLLSELTRRHVTVALSGDGGDELFAGYERFAAALAVEPYLRIPAPLRGAGRRLLMRLPRRAFKGRVGSLQRFVEGAEQGLPDGYLSWVGLASADRCRSLVPTQSPWALQDYERIWQKTHGADLLYRLLYLNLSTYLLDDLLVKIDRTSMGHALEVRCPFLDKDLLDFALRLPREARIKGFSRKRVLKEAVKDLLPKDILNRRKRGFGVPLDRWFREDLGSYVEARLGSATARVREHLNGREVDRILAEHRTGARDRGQLLWTLLTLEVFLRKEGW